MVHHVMMMHVVMVRVMMVMVVVDGLGVSRGAESNSGDQPDQGHNEEFLNHRNLGCYS